MLTYLGLPENEGLWNASLYAMDIGRFTIQLVFP